MGVASWLDFLSVFKSISKSNITSWNFIYIYIYIKFHEVILLLLIDLNTDKKSNQLATPTKSS